MKRLVIALFSFVVAGCYWGKAGTMEVEKIKIGNKKGRKIRIETQLNVSADLVWEKFKSAQLWGEAVKPQAILRPLADSMSEAQWAEGKKYSYHLWMYYFIPFGKHHIELQKFDADNGLIETHEYGFMVPNWDNRFEVIAQSDTTCLVRDVLIIQSKGINPIVTVYAKDLLRAKHKRLKVLFMP